MKKGNDKDKDLDFSEFDEEMENTAKKKTDDASDVEDSLDDSIFSGDFDVDTDNIPVLTDVVGSSENKNDFDEFEFEEVIEDHENTISNKSDEEVEVSDFDFEDPKTDDINISSDDTAFADFSFDEPEPLVTADEQSDSEFNFDELDSELENRKSVVTDAKTVDDDFNFDELDSELNNRQVINEEASSKNEDDFNFDELDKELSGEAVGKDNNAPVAEPESDFDFETIDNENKANENVIESTVDDDFNFEELDKDLAIKPENSNSEETVDNSDFDFADFDGSEDQKVNEPTAADDFDFDAFEAESATPVNATKDDDFDFDDTNTPSKSSEEFDFEESFETNKNDDFTFDDDVKDDFEEILEKDVEAVLSTEDNLENSKSKDDDFDFMNADAVDEPNDIVNNDIYDNNRDKGISEMNDPKDKEFDFDDNDFDFGDNDVSAKKNEDEEYDNFDFGSETTATKNDDFDTTFNLESSEKEDEFNFGNTKDDADDFGFEKDEHDDTPVATNKNDDDDIVNEDKPKKSSSNIIKYSVLALAIALVGGGGYIGYNKFMTPSFEEVEAVQTPKPKKVVKADKPKAEVKPKVTQVAETPKTDISSDLAGLDDITPSKPTKKETQPVIDNTASMNNQVSSPQNAQLAQDYEKLQGQFAQVIGSVSKMSDQLESLKSENARMKDILNKVKNDNTSAEFESFQLDFSALKNDVAGLKSQVLAEKSFNKDTMIKFLTISKKLKEEVTALKSSQISKEELDSKLNEIGQLSKQVEVLNTKVSNTEVMSKIATLEKTMNDKKLQDVEKEINKTKETQAKNSNKQKSVLELLEEKNKEKDLEKNTVVVEEEEDLKVPLSVTIEEDSAADEKPVVKKQTVKKKVKNEYSRIGTIEGVVYLKNTSGSISEYRVNDKLPGYGEILKIYKDGSIETESGSVTFKEE